MTIEIIDNKFISRLAKSVGTSEKEQSKAVNEMLRKDPSDYFSEQYLVYSEGGRTFARDFEIKTTKITFIKTVNIRVRRDINAR